MQPTFGHTEMISRIKRDSALMKAHALIEWESLRPLLKGLYRRETSNAGGQEPIDALLMFKATLLGQWHSLSDPKLEEALHLRIDFMHFCGLNLVDNVPDETTLCRFRNRLVNTNKLAPLLAAVNAQLQGHGLMVKHAHGAVIDATLITAAARPKREVTLEEQPTDQHTPDEYAPTKPTPANSADHSTATATTAAADAAITNAKTLNYSVETSVSVDPDATWLKKGSKSTFGFRSYFTVDNHDGYVRGVHTAPANQSEFNHFKAGLAAADFTPKRTYADKGFASQANRSHLRDNQIKSAIMHRAVKNKPLSERQKNANKRISKTRYIVEQCFGTLKRMFKMGRASYMGTMKVNGQMLLKAMCMNLLKAANKICLMPPSTGGVRRLAAEVSV